MEVDQWIRTERLEQAHLNYWLYSHSDYYTVDISVQCVKDGLLDKWF